MQSKRVAIVGSGCSGLATLWALKSTNHDVHLYEAADRLGGHTNTVKFKHNGLETNVDTGFIVYNRATYPNFIAFLKAVGVDTVPTEMSFGVSRDNGAFEWAGTNLGAIFAQRGNIFSLSMWRMIFDIVRFNQFALDLLHGEDESEGDMSGVNDVTASGNGHASKKYHKPRPQHHESIGQYLDRENYSQAFRDNYLIPMTAAVWSTEASKCSLEFPAMTLVRFMWNHHLLSTVAARPDWMTLPGGSKNYIDAIMRDFPREKVHCGRAVREVESVTVDGTGMGRSGRNMVVVRFEDGTEEEFDHVVMACHGDTTAEILKRHGTDREREVLSCFRTSENVAVLHSDLSLMPRRREAWSAWNIMSDSVNGTTDSKPAGVCLTYDMNILQHIPTSKYGDVLVTLNPIHKPAKHTIQGQWTYHHPLYNASMVSAQKALPAIQNTRGISYAGAWTKYGFHEDGFSSGLKVAIEHLGAELPFEFVDSTFSRGRRPVLKWQDWVVRVVVRYIQFWITFGTLLLRLVKMALEVGGRQSGMKSVKLM